MFSLFSLTLYILIAAIGLIMGLSSKQAIANLQVIKPNPTKVFRWFMILFVAGIVITLLFSYFATNSLTSVNIPEEGSMKFQNFKSIMLFVQNVLFLALVVISNIYSLTRKKISLVPYLLTIVLYTFFVLLDAHYLADYYVVWQKSLRILKGGLPDFHSTAWVKCGLGASVTIFNAVMNPGGAPGNKRSAIKIMYPDFTALEKIRKYFQTYQRPWFFCGGWAIDLFIGKKTREHSDIEIGIFRDDQLLLQQYLHAYKLFWIDNGEKHAWLKDAYLNLPVHEIWAKGPSLEFELLLNNANGDYWLYRRNPDITMPVSHAIMIKDEIPFLCPEIVLLYKSKRARPKDEDDLEHALPFMNLSQRQWLKESLNYIDSTHPWIGYR